MKLRLVSLILIGIDYLLRLDVLLGLPMADLLTQKVKGGFAMHGFFARPVVGGHISFLALDKACDNAAAAGLEFLNSIWR